MDVGVLGCGPSGLMVAFAVYQAGHNPIIISRKKKSIIGGAQYVHQEIPDLPVAPQMCHINFLGTAEGYAQKVYGDPQAPTSWGRFTGEHQIWPMRSIYDILWDMFSDSITDIQVGSSSLAGLVNGPIFSTIPLREICYFPQDHKFQKQDVWLTYHESQYARDANFVTYNGMDIHEWYRYSQLFGWESHEYSQDPVDWMAPEVYQKGLVKVSKPTLTNCTCHPTVYKFGRFGRWDKWELTHNAYWKAHQAIARIEQGVVL